MVLARAELLGDLREGAVEEVKSKVLADQLGRKLATEFGLLDAIKERRKARRG